MFSGIVARTGKIVSLNFGQGGGAHLAVDAGSLASRLRSGDSIAVDGICLTVVKKKGRQIWMNVSAETLRLTNLAHRREGHYVNLEPSISANTALSGHFVQGHVEGLARVKRWVCRGEDIRLVLELPAELVEFCISKGSIAVNGVSLTVASMKGSTIQIALIPYTLQMTNLNQLQAGDLVNIETDMIGRYVVSALKKEYHRRKL